MQQRLQIARSLAQDPSVLLMDEPFGALDAMTRQSLQDEVLRIAAERQATVLFVTHDLEEALYLGDRIVALHSNPGRIARVVDIPLPRPRDQLATREHPSSCACGASCSRSWRRSTRERSQRPPPASPPRAGGDPGPATRSTSLSTRLASARCVGLRDDGLSGLRAP